MALPEAQSAERAEHLEIDFTYPTSGEAVTGPDGRGFIAGWAVPFRGERRQVEIMFVLDVSGSTAASSGADVDGDGRITGDRLGGGLLRRFFGVRLRENPDSIQAAEVASVRTLIEQLDPANARAGVVVFSGDGQPTSPDAVLEVRLTRDYRRLKRALDEILLVPPEGGTNMLAGLELAARELLRGSKRARRGAPRGDGDPDRFIVFLTDGEPTLPRGRDAIARPLRLARSAAKRGIRILSFAIGPEAVRGPEVPREAARLTGGQYVAVEDPRKLETLVSKVRLTELESVHLQNATTGQSPDCETLSPDGRFAALIPMRAGTNTIEVRARSAQGSQKIERREVRFDAGGPDIPSGLDAVQRTDLARLRELCRRPDARQGMDRGLEIETVDPRRE